MGDGLEEGFVDFARETGVAGGVCGPGCDVEGDEIWNGLESGLYDTLLVLYIVKGDEGVLPRKQQIGRLGRG